MSKTYLNVKIEDDSVEYLADETGVSFEEAEKYVEEVIVPQIEDAVQIAFEEADLGK